MTRTTSPSPHSSIPKDFLLTSTSRSYVPNYSQKSYQFYSVVKNINDIAEV